MNKRLVIPFCGENVSSGPKVWLLWRLTCVKGVVKYSGFSPENSHVGVSRLKVFRLAGFDIITSNYRKEYESVNAVVYAQTK
jgi:hypothetical protein